MGYNILHNVYISPHIYSKFTTGASPMCPKCKTNTGTRIHCLWECEKIQQFWLSVCGEISLVIGQKLYPSPLLCLLGNIPNSLRAQNGMIQFLLMLARKTIMTKWVGDESPSLILWKSLISDVITLENLRYCITGRADHFKREWEKSLNLLNVKCNV